MVCAAVFQPLFCDAIFCWRFRSFKMIDAVKKKLRKNNFDLVEIGCISLYQYAKLIPDLPKLLIHHNIESQLLHRRIVPYVF